MIVLPRRTRPPKQVRIAGIVAAVAGVAGAFATNLSIGRARTTHTTGFDLGSVGMIMILAITVGVPVVVAFMIRLRNNSTNNESGSDDMNTTANSAADDADEQQDADRKPLILGLAAVSAVMAILIVFLVWPKGAAAQTAADRGAFVIHNGADTVVVDRFSRNENELRGMTAVRGQGRIEYVMTFGPENTVRTLQLSSFKPGATATDTAIAKVLATLRGDSVTFTTAGKPTSVPTKSGAIPSFNNAISITEVFTRRARAARRYRGLLVSRDVGRLHDPADRAVGGRGLGRHHARRATSALQDRCYRADPRRIDRWTAVCRRPRDGGAGFENRIWNAAREAAS